MRRAIVWMAGCLVVLGSLASRSGDHALATDVNQWVTTRPPTALKPTTQNNVCAAMFLLLRTEENSGPRPFVCPSSNTEPGVYQVGPPNSIFVTAAPPSATSRDPFDWKNLITTDIALEQKLSQRQPISVPPLTAPPSILIPTDISHTAALLPTDASHELVEIVGVPYSSGPRPTFVVPTVDREPGARAAVKVITAQPAKP